MSFQADRPFETLHQCLASALHKDFDDITYKTKDWEASKNKDIPVFVDKTRRPEIRDVEVTMFVQTWSDTSLGFGGMAGQAFTSAYTVVLLCIDTAQYAVYHGGRLAYMIDGTKSGEGYYKFIEDLANRNLAGRMNMGRYNQ